MFTHYQCNYLVNQQQVIVADHKQAKSLYDFNKRNKNNVHLCMIGDNLFAVWPK